MFYLGVVRSFVFVLKEVHTHVNEIFLEGKLRGKTDDICTKQRRILILSRKHKSLEYRESNLIGDYGS